MLSHRKEIDNIRYKTISCQRLSNDELRQCKDLFDGHYGIWGEGSPRKGKRINFPLRNYEEYRRLENTFVALAILDGRVIGQAFYLKDVFGKNDHISWVLQLVVHEKYRKQGIAKTLLYSIWGFSGDYAWGLDNLKILKTIRKHLQAKGYLVISVMNLELTEHIAKNVVEDVRSDPNALIRLPPSKIMKTSGNVFDPGFFLLESRTGVVYRKEQFENDGALSAEYVIRDKRFSKTEICSLLKKAGFEILETRYVQAGKWDTLLEATDPKAKEVLVFAQKRDFLCR